MASGSTQTTSLGHGTGDKVDDSLDIFRVARDYIESRITLSDLEEWLVPRLGFFLRDLNSTASQLAAVVEISFADVAAGEATEEEIRGLVSDFIRDNQPVFLTEGKAATASNAYTEVVVTYSGAVRDSRFTWLEPSPAGI